MSGSCQRMNVLLVLCLVGTATADQSSAGGGGPVIGGTSENNGNDEGNLGAKVGLGVGVGTAASALALGLGLGLGLHKNATNKTVTKSIPSVSPVPSVPHCTLPLNAAGYQPDSCELSLEAEKCTVKCAEGYVGTAVQKCVNGGTFQLSGCTLVTTTPAAAAPIGGGFDFGPYMLGLLLLNACFFVLALVVLFLACRKPKTRKGKAKRAANLKEKSRDMEMGPSEAIIQEPTTNPQPIIQEPTAIAQQPLLANMAFNAMDRNHDGVVTRAEFYAAAHRQ